MQITQHKNDFWKPLEQYKILDIFGKNVLSVEGQIWRRHRKVVGPPFTERNNHLVWNESLYASHAMIDTFLNPDGKSTQTIDDLMPSMGRVALSVISKAGYGVRMDWPSRVGKQGVNDDDTSSDPVLNRAWVEGKTNGHTLSFGDAIYNVSHHIIPLLLFPQWALKRLPFESTRKSWEAYWNWGNYMREMIVAKKRHVGDIEPAAQSYDLLANLVKSSADSSRLDANEKPDKAGQAPADKFTDDEVLGNAFLLIVAGHETSAGALQHLTLMMAMNPATQRPLQKELDDIFAGADPSTWDYERDFPRVFGGMPGAVLAETLRLIPAALAIPKVARHDTDVLVDGQNCRIPGGTVINVSIAAAQRNPKYWKAEKPDPDAPTFAGEQGLDASNDLAEFKPQRWIINTAALDNTEYKMPENKLTVEENALGVNNAADTAATLLKPERGAYLPFMEGHRACMGRRFAQVEIMAIMSLIFQTYSVELAVDKWASDEEVSRMSVEEKKAVWRKARDEAEGHFRSSMMTIITHKMLKGQVPVRFVKRGEERFPIDRW